MSKLPKILTQCCLTLTLAATHVYQGRLSNALRVLCRLQTLINYALKAERDLWGLLDGPWDGPGYADHRRTWSTQASHLSGGHCTGPIFCNISWKQHPAQYYDAVRSFISLL